MPHNEYSGSSAAIKTELSPTILVIEDNPDDIRVLSSFIGDLGKVVFAANGEDGIKMAANLKPDLILLDIELPDIMGPEVFKKIQEDSDTAIIFVTSHSGATNQIAALESGALDFISKPFKPDIIRKSILQQLINKKTDGGASTLNKDRITHTYTRRYFDQQLSQKWLEQQAQEGFLAMALIHINQLQEYEDSFGSLKADNALKNIAQALGDGFYKEKELLAKFGPKKFAILTAASDKDSVGDWGQRLIETVSNLAIPFKQESSPFITASVGICIAQPTSNKKLANFVEGSYSALSQARELGQNQFSVIHLP